MSELRHTKNVILVAQLAQQELLKLIRHFGWLVHTRCIGRLSKFHISRVFDPSILPLTVGGGGG